MPLTAEAEAAALLAALRDALMIRQLSGSAGLAVSGGSDSMAMLHLMAKLGAELGLALQVVTLNHGLRAEAAEECAFVGKVCAGYGLRHQVLAWDKRPDGGNLMQEASRARYGMITAWARRQGLSDVLIAHTADDQAETLLMGLSRAAGLDGLAGLRPEWTQDGIRFLRPLLSSSRAALRGYLQHAGHDWRDDPSNEDSHYARARLRKALKLLAPLGLTAENLSRSVQHLAASRNLLQSTLAESFARLGTEVAGALFLDRQAFWALQPELRRGLLRAALLYLPARRHAPRAEAIAGLEAQLRLGKNAVLAGCRFRITARQLQISRETARLTEVAPLGELWAGRWQIEGPGGADLEVRALGLAGLQHLGDWRRYGLPREVLMATPGIWQAMQLRGAPAVAQGPWQAQIASSFQFFILSH